MSILSTVLAGAAAVAQSIAPAVQPIAAGIAFRGSEIQPIAHAPGLFAVPSLSRGPGNLAIAVPERGVVLFLHFQCAAHTFELQAIGRVMPTNGDALVIAQVAHPRAPQTVPAGNSERTKAAELAACGLGI